MSSNVILADRFGPEILTMLEIKGQVLHRVHIRKFCCQKNSLLTRKLPMILSRSNEIIGGNGNISLF